jgi:hypothetical protein
VTEECRRVQTASEMFFEGHLIEGSMLGGIWSFLQGENNRAVLTWIGGGIAVVIGAVWAVLKFFFAQKSVQKGVPGPTVMATHRGETRYQH